jgi:hypothetical protein
VYWTLNLPSRPGFRERAVHVVESGKDDFDALDLRWIDAVLCAQSECRVDRTVREVIARVFLETHARIDHAQRLCKAVDEPLGFALTVEERVEEAFGSEQIGTRRPAHAREHRTFDTHARSVSRMRRFGHGARVDRDAPGARARKTERHQHLPQIEIERAAHACNRAERACHAGLVKAGSGLHARCGESHPALHFECRQRSPR